MQENTPISRRTLLQGAAVAGAAALVIGEVREESATAAGIPTSVAEGADAKAQYGFLFRIDHCVGCEKCVAACRKYNRLSDETPDRRRVTHFANKRKEDVTVSMSCMHCVEPNCERVCPAGAISKGDCGIVSVDKEKCIGCKYCYEACPYDVPRYTSEGMDKCDCCLTAGLPAGSEPYCVQACIFDALNWGKINEMKEKFPDAIPIGEPGNPSVLVVNR